MDEKSKLRLKLREQRRSIPAKETQEWDQQIFTKLKAVVKWQQIKSIHIYLPMPLWREVDTWPLIKYIWQDYPSVLMAAPKIDGKEMQAIVINSKTKLAKNAAGILEPAEGRVLNPNYKFDLILVPTLGFDSSGYRLGSGSGHYDRFLANHTNSRLVGLCYEIGYLDKPFNHEAHDIKINQLVTEKDVYNF